MQQAIAMKYPKPKPKLLEKIMHPNDSKLNQLPKIQENT
jgi:hypothetical protein